MKKYFSFLTVILLSLALVGCATQPGQPGLTNTQGGAIAGGVIGGLLGSTIGSGSGQAAAIVGGVLIGSLLGAKVGQSMDQQARMRAEMAGHDAFQSGRTVYWKSGRRYRGYVRPHRRYYSDRYGEYCRDYSTNIVIDGRTHVARGVACRNRRSGRWHIVT